MAQGTMATRQHDSQTCTMTALLLEEFLEDVCNMLDPSLSRYRLLELLD